MAFILATSSWVFCRVSIKSLSITLGGLISYNSLEEVSGFDYKGLLVHLNILEKTYICKRVSPYFTNKRTEIIKVPKVYFFDAGFRNIIIDDFRAYDLRQDIGSLNENFVFTQATYAGVEVKFWRSKSRAEVDFVMEREGKLIAIESKSIFRRRTKSLTAFIDKYNPYQTIVAHRGGLEVRGGVVYLPLVFVSALV